jgi:hypothetical protein
MKGTAQEGAGEVDGRGLLEQGPHYLNCKWVLWFDSALQVCSRVIKPKPYTPKPKA